MIVAPKTEVWGWDVVPAVGKVVKPDGWASWAWGKLQPGIDWFCPFYLPTGNSVIKELAVRIDVTGRTLQSFQGERCVRVRITFIGDCEPDTVTYGWMQVPWK